MMLRQILTDKYAVNVLKLLYDKEFVQKGGYSTNLSDLTKNLGVGQIPASSIDILQNSGLIGVDVGKGSQLLTITEKGKHFILLFDKMVQFFASKDIVKREPRYKVEYNLTQMERRILYMCYRMAKEVGGEFSLDALVSELFPHEDMHEKKRLIGKHISRLSHLNLVNKIKMGRETYLRISDSGQRVIREQFLEHLL